MPSAGGEALEEGLRRRRLVEMEGLRIVGGGEFLDRGRFDANLPGPILLADGEVLEVQRGRGQPP
jgi:hypothetical protein